MINRCVECGHKECVCDSAIERLALKVLTYVVAGLGIFILGALAAMFVVSFADPGSQDQSVDAFQPVETYAKEIEYALRADLIKPGCIKVNRPTVTIKGGKVVGAGIKGCL